MSENEYKPCYIQYSHDRKHWFALGPSIKEGCFPVVFDTVERALDVCKFTLGESYAGHVWHQRIMDAMTDELLLDVRYERPSDSD